MTELLEKAFAQAATLSDDEQNQLAEWILAELESENHWQELFERSGSLLDQMADEALAEYHTGQTEPLDPDSL